MASITIRRLEESTKERLRRCASHHGRSMEAEAREILTVFLTGKGAGGRNLAESIRRRFEPLGGVGLPSIPRELMRQPPKLGR